MPTLRQSHQRFKNIEHARGLLENIGCECGSASEVRYEENRRDVVVNAVSMGAVTMDAGRGIAAGCCLYSLFRRDVAVDAGRGIKTGRCLHSLFRRGNVTGVGRDIRFRC